MGAFEDLKQKSISNPQNPTQASSAFQALKQKSVTQSVAPEKKRGIFGTVTNFLAPTATKSVEKLQAGEKLGFRDIAGSALEIGSIALPVGGIVRGVGLAAKGLGLAAKGLGARALEGAAIGAVSGGMAEGGRAIGEGANVMDTTKQALTGATIGAPFGAALPVAAAGVGKVVNKAKGAFVKRAATKATETDLLTRQAPDARVATKSLSKEGNIVDDPIASETVRQGIPEADVALIKNASELDKAKMRRMLDVRESQLTNKRVTERATDVVGDTFITKVATPIQDLNRQAARGLNQVATRLAGKKVNSVPAVEQLAKTLDEVGVTLGEKGKLNFKNSSFEGLRGPQALFQNVWNRAIRVAKSGDALQAHRLKSYIDEIVEYGKEAEGLSGKAQLILKQFRRNVDGILDQTFPMYNSVNTVYSDTINTLNKLGVVLGKKFRLGDSFSDAQSGLAIRRILSNTQSRAEILRLLDEMQQVAKKYDIPIDEDIITQANFADVLEKMLGTEAPTSLMGQVERGVEQAGGAVADFAQGRPIRAGIQAGKALLDATRGISKENQRKALRALLGDGLPEPRQSVFGKKPVPKGKAAGFGARSAAQNPEAFGALGGLEQDEETGKMSFSPEKALLGVGLMTAVTRGGGKGKAGDLLTEAKKYKSVDEFADSKFEPVENFSGKPGQGKGASTFYGKPGTVSPEDYGPIKTEGYVDKTKIYEGNSSFDYAKEAGLLDKPLPLDLQKLTGLKTFKQVDDAYAEGVPKMIDGLKVSDEFQRNPNIWYAVTQQLAERDLRGKGFAGAKWSYEDDLVPTQYQIWDKDSAFKTKSQLTSIWNEANQRNSKSSESLLKPKPGTEALGGVAGIEQDEEGKISFNPEKAALGVGALAGITKARKSNFGRQAKVIGAGAAAGVGLAGADYGSLYMRNALNQAGQATIEDQVATLIRQDKLSEANDLIDQIPDVAIQNKLRREIATINHRRFIEQMQARPTNFNQ